MLDRIRELLDRNLQKVFGEANAARFAALSLISRTDLV
jgi:hypothetical protein